MNLNTCIPIATALVVTLLCGAPVEAGSPGGDVSLQARIQHLQVAYDLDRVAF